MGEKSELILGNLSRSIWKHFGQLHHKHHKHIRLFEYRQMITGTNNTMLI